MSHDGLFILRENGRDQCFYSRWGALNLDRDLLYGPESTISYIRSLRSTDEPFTEPWLCGFIYCDIDTRRLVYWADQFFGPPGLLRYYEVLLAQQWQGWKTRWSFRPIRDIAELLDTTFETLGEAEQECQKISYEDLVAAQEYEWQQWMGDDKPEMKALLAEVGEEQVRAWAEATNDCWVTVRWQDGRLSDYLLDRMYGHNSSLMAGPDDFLIYLRQRPAIGDLSKRVREDGAKSCIFIDEATYKVDWWWEADDWDGAVYWVEKLWPGWEVNQHGDGPLHHMQLSGRPLSPIICPPDETWKQLSEQFGRTFDPNFSPLNALIAVSKALSDEEKQKAAATGTTPNQVVINASGLGNQPANPPNDTYEKLLARLHQLIFGLS